MSESKKVLVIHDGRGRFLSVQAHAMHVSVLTARDEEHWAAVPYSSDNLPDFNPIRYHNLPVRHFRYLVNGSYETIQVASVSPSDFEEWLSKSLAIVIPRKVVVQRIKGHIVTKSLKPVPLTCVTYDGEQNLFIEAGQSLLSAIELIIKFLKWHSDWFHRNESIPFISADAYAIRSLFYCHRFEPQITPPSPTFVRLLNSRMWSLFVRSHGYHSPLILLPNWDAPDSQRTDSSGAEMMQLVDNWRLSGGRVIEVTREMLHGEAQLPELYPDNPS